ncbi:GTPase HflX [Treponema sp.]|uniref:GTPase HflX n=1 Tax=Treponema sp. TaxID=166 RepID=UPI003F124F2D
MVEIRQEQEQKVRCLLVGAPDKKSGNPEPQELQSLVRTLDMETAGTVVLTRIEPTPAYGIGTGKAQEIADRAKELSADCIIFDWEIDPSKQRNWEKLSGMPVFDRNEVIIRIFDSRAQTKEASLQVELAKLQYSLPRLSHTYGDMARQRGGAFGNKGSGETQLELDRRQIEDKIVQIKKELAQVAVNRNIQRRQRERTAAATCSLVGYTNAGKSSLLNALTGADVLVENKLFATLDPTTRKCPLSEASSVLMTDTVGFISNLPHTLIDAFKSTLEETVLSDFLLVVVDASDPECKKQYDQVQKVLKEIHAENIPQAIVLNKFDRVKDNIITVSTLNKTFPQAIHASAKTGMGFDQIISVLTENLLGKEWKFEIPMESAPLVELARKNGTIKKEEWLEDRIELTARIPGKFDENGNGTTRTLSLLKEFIK